MATQLKEPEAPLDTGQDSDLGGDGAPAVIERDYEAEARAHGWRPRDEFKGDPMLWTDAETFAKRAEEVLPFVKKENKQLRGELDFLKRQIKKVMKSEQAAYANAVADLEARQEKAVETGNLAEHRRLKGEIDKVRENMVSDTPSDGADKRKEAVRAFADWRDQNEWYDLGGQAGASIEERRQRAYFDRMVEANEDLAQTMDPPDFIAHIAELVEAKYPTAKTPRPKPPSDVAGVTPPGQRGKAKTGAALPLEAKETAERYIRLGIPGYKGKTKAEAYDLFAKDYDWSA